MPFSHGLQIGPYIIMEQVGQGGMATVYKARHASLDRYVAIKVLNPAFMEDSSFQARFQREARVVARLDHPNIVPIYDYAEHEGQPYLVMKFIEGETLKDRLQRGPLSASEVQNIVESIGAGLAYAHKQGILHRDIKPSNVILSKDGGTYLADFGLARIALSGESTLTVDMVLGTPQYISPEQALSKKDLDEGTDIYSFGVMLYEMTVGRVPFSADAPFSVIHDHIYTPLPLPTSVNPKITPDLENVLVKALAKERADRYADIPALVEAFKQAWTNSASTIAIPLGTLGLAAAPVADSKPSAPITLPITPGSAARLSPASAAHPEAENQPSDKKKSRSLWVWISVVAAIGLISLGFFAASRARFNLFAAPPAPPQSVIATEVPAAPPAAVPTVAAVIPATIPPTPAGQPQGEKIDLTVVIDLTKAKKALDANPNDSRPRLIYGVALLRNNKAKEGYLEISHAAELAVKNPAFLIGAARALDKANLPLGAAIIYLKLAEIGKNVSTPANGPLANNLNRSIYYGFGDPLAPEVLDYGKIGKVSEALSFLAQVRYSIINGKDPAMTQALLDKMLAFEPNVAVTELLRAESFIVTKQDIPGARKMLEGIFLMPNVPDWVVERAKELRQSVK